MTPSLLDLGDRVFLCVVAGNQVVGVEFCLTDQSFNCLIDGGIWFGFTIIELLHDVFFHSFFLVAGIDYFCVHVYLKHIIGGAAV